MAATTLTDCRIYVGGFDFSAAANSVNLQTSVDDADVTTFNSSGWRERVPGLKDVNAKCDVFNQANNGVGTGVTLTGTPDDVDGNMFNNLAVTTLPVAIGTTATEGTTAYLFQAGSFTYNLLGDIGALSQSTLELQCSNTQGLIRGQLGKKKGNVSATGALGTGLNLGAVGATQFLYATFHVFTAATTLTVQIQSDTTSGFGAPTTRATLGPFISQTGTYLTRVAGAITDTWWRFNVSAITGTFSVGGVIAVQ